MMKGLCILGATGSVGRNTLLVVKRLSDRFRVVSLAARKNLDLLAQQVLEFAPQVVSVGSRDCVEPLRQRLKAKGFSRPLKILAETEGQVEAATLAEVDFVVSASHGVTGLKSTFEAVRAGKTIGLANKEVLVVAGELVTRAARDHGVDLLPIDSEHGAIHQCLRSGQTKEVRQLILTGSGGPFLKTPRKEFARITPEQALRHPVWKMGGRITIDSATLMNKGLEIIEAHWLFGLPSASIEVVIHPESIIHSMIEFQDGSVMAQLSVADMRLPIQYALTYPDRVATNGSIPALDLVAAGELHFRKPDLKRFPCLEFGRVALERGGVAGCAMNAADELAVEEFLAGRLGFADIPSVVHRVMEQAPNANPASLEEILEYDREFRTRAAEVIRSIQ